VSRHGLVGRVVRGCYPCVTPVLWRLRRVFILHAVLTVLRCWYISSTPGWFAAPARSLAPCCPSGWLPPGLDCWLSRLGHRGAENGGRTGGLLIVTNEVPIFIIPATNIFVIAGISGAICA
jgi:hypothetical protein